MQLHSFSYNVRDVCVTARESCCTVLQFTALAAAPYACRFNSTYVCMPTHAQIGPLVGGLMMETMNKTRVMSCSVSEAAVQQQAAASNADNSVAAVAGANNSANNSADDAAVRREAAAAGGANSNRRQKHNVSDKPLLLLSSLAVLSTSYALAHVTSVSCSIRSILFSLLGVFQIV